MTPDKVCVVVGRTRHKMMAAELAEAPKRGAAFIEVRLDFLAKAVEFARLAPLKACAWMATLRRPPDGGRFAGSEADRLTILRQAIVSGAFEWVDLETDVADGVRRFGPVKRVVSYHNLRETPADLEAIYAKMCQQDADVLKLAVTAKSVDDCKRVIALQRAATRPTIAFCMGDIGVPTRFIALKFGAPWIYAAFNPDRGFAPGLPTLSELRTTYPVRRIDADTKIYGLFGDPVSHSYSPVLHNHTLGRLKQNAVYLPFRVPAGQLAAAVAAYRDVSVSGYSVTIPHKEAAVAVGPAGDAAVAACGAANTVVREPGGGFTTYNTDHSAAFASLEAALAGQGRPAADIAKLFVLVLGAGGAARAVAHALHAAGAHVTVSARTAERATKLAADLGCRAVAWEKRHDVLPCDVAVNCTPLGMTPNTDASPLHISFLKPELTVFDTVYTPEQTLLVKQARERGCKVVTGVDMFVRQAARQVELFTGLTPDVAGMRDLLRKAMSPLTRALDDDAAGGDWPVAVRRQVALVGLRGAGKSTVGRLVAERLGWPFADTDDAVEAAAGRGVAEVFAAEGEAAFREREAAALAELLGREPVVVATGGGAVLGAGNRAILKQCGMVVWLTADPADLAGRLATDPATAARRPALTALPAADELAALLVARADHYLDVATLVVPTAGHSPAAVADRILDGWRELTPDAKPGQA